jgi:hypothetical protein
MSILSPTKEENAVEGSPGSVGQSPQEPNVKRPSQSFKETRFLADGLQAADPKASDVVQTSSPQQLKEQEFHFDISHKDIHHIFDVPSSFESFVVSEPPKIQEVVSNTVSVSAGQTLHGPQNTASIRVADNSSPVREHAFNAYPPNIELKDWASTKQLDQQTSPGQEQQLEDCSRQTAHKDSAPITKPKYLLKQAQIIEPRELQPSVPRPSYPDITLSRVPSSSQTNPSGGAFRRISASEPGLRPVVPSVRPIRHSKSAFVEKDDQNASETWRTPEDPLTRVSVADDLASLAALAHVLEEEPADTSLHSSDSAKAGGDTASRIVGDTFDVLARQDIECRLPQLIRELEETETRRALAKDESDFAKLAREVTDEYAGGTLVRAK